MNNWIEKILFAIIPVLLSGSVYLLNTILSLQEQVNKLEDDIQIANDDLKDKIKDDIHDIDKRVSVIEAK